MSDENENVIDFATEKARREDTPLLGFTELLEGNDLLQAKLDEMALRLRESELKSNERFQQLLGSLEALASGQEALLRTQRGAAAQPSVEAQPPVVHVHVEQPFYKKHPIATVAVTGFAAYGLYHFAKWLGGLQAEDARLRAERFEREARDATAAGRALASALHGEQSRPLSRYEYNERHYDTHNHTHQNTHHHTHRPVVMKEKAVPVEVEKVVEVEKLVPVPIEVRTVVERQPIYQPIREVKSPAKANAKQRRTFDMHSVLKAMS